MQELCENAVEHTDHECPEVTLAVELPAETADQVTLIVADDGPGIPAHERDVQRAGGETPLEHGSGWGSESPTGSPAGWAGSCGSPRTRPEEPYRDAIGPKGYS